MKTVRLLMAMLAVTAIAPTAQAGLLGHLKPSGCGESVASGFCSGPCSACTPQVEKVKVTRSCYKPKREAICIPPIKFPWMKCNEFGTPKIRCVNRFEKEEIDCGEKCVIVWKLDPEVAKGYCKCNGGGCFGSNNGGCGACGGAGCAGGCTDGGFSTMQGAAPGYVPPNSYVIGR